MLGSQDISLSVGDVLGVIESLEYFFIPISDEFVVLGQSPLPLLKHIVNVLIISYFLLNIELLHYFFNMVFLLNLLFLDL